MRLGIPHLANIYIPFKSVAHSLGGELIVPPLSNAKTLTLGARYSPEGVCLPFKLTLGNLIQAAEAGADVLLMFGGYGICRLGYYAKIQENVLRDLGYDADIVSMGLSERKLMEMLDIIKGLAGNASWLKILSAFRFGLSKLTTVDEIEKTVHKVRATEKVKGTANSIYRRALTKVDSAESYDTLKRTVKESILELENVPRGNGEKPLVVGITGEIYVLLEPFSNLDIESELGWLGVQVKRKVFVSEWVKFSWFLNALGFDEHRRVHRAAYPYLKHDIGGDGWESVGDKVLHANDYDGLIHIAPFTCMPEVVAQSIMQKTREKLPVLTVLCDEQMGRAGLLTRLEAFTDLLERRRKMKSNKHNGHKSVSR